MKFKSLFSSVLPTLTHLYLESTDNNQQEREKIYNTLEICKINPWVILYLAAYYHVIMFSLYLHITECIAVKN